MAIALRLLRIVTAALILIAVVVQLLNPADPWAQAANFFSFFTIQSNLLAAGVLLVVALRGRAAPGTRLELFRGAARRLRSVTTAAAITGGLLVAAGPAAAAPRDSPATPGKVYFTGGEQFAPVSRPFPSSGRRLPTALRELLEGPTAAEEKRGFGTAIPAGSKVCRSASTRPPASPPSPSTSASSSRARRSGPGPTRFGSTSAGPARWSSPPPRCPRCAPCASRFRARMW